jgi:hypothetical protein
MIFDSRTEVFIFFATYRTFVRCGCRSTFFSVHIDSRRSTFSRLLTSITGWSRAKHFPLLTIIFVNWANASASFLDGYADIFFLASISIDSPGTMMQVLSTTDLRAMCFAVCSILADFYR